MSPEPEKVIQLQDLKFEGLGPKELASLSIEEKIEIIKSAEIGELRLEDFLFLFEGVDDDRKDEIVATLETNDIQIIEDSNNSTFYEPRIARKKTNKSTAKKEHEPDPGDNLGQYLTEIGKIPLLTAQQEVLLSKRIEKGRKASEKMAKGAVGPKKKAELKQIVEDGGAAREHLITANSRLVISVAKKHMGKGVPFLDMIQDGNIGLMRAAKKFDYRRGHRFSTYATWWIRQAVTRAIANHSRTIRLPVHAHETINKIRKTTRHLEQKLGRKPTTEEIAHELELPQEKVEELIKANRPPLSLETPTGPEEDAELVDFIEDESSPEPVKAADETMLQQQIRDALQTLTPREARVLELRYGLKDDQPLYLEEIGLKLGVTKERARQIEVEALSQLRHPKVRHRLADYLRE